MSQIMSSPPDPYAVPDIPYRECRGTPRLLVLVGYVTISLRRLTQTRLAVLARMVKQVLEINFYAEIGCK